VLESITDSEEKEIRLEEKTQHTATTSPEESHLITAAHSTPQKKMKRRTITKRE